MTQSGETMDSLSIHETLKTKFIEGNPIFMSFVAITFIIGLTICIERIVYLSLANINTKKLISKIEQFVAEGKTAEAIKLCQDTRGPVASICLQGLLHADDAIDHKQSIMDCAGVEISKLEKGCTGIPWHCRRHGHVFRQHRDCRRYKPNDCCGRHETCAYNHHFWNNRCCCAADIL